MYLRDKRQLSVVIILLGLFKFFKRSRDVFLLFSRGVITMDYNKKLVFLTANILIF